MNFALFVFLQTFPVTSEVMLNEPQGFFFGNVCEVMGLYDTLRLVDTSSDLYRILEKNMGDICVWVSNVCCLFIPACWWTPLAVYIVPYC